MSTASNERSAEAALRALGVRCSVEPRGKLAVLLAAPGERSLERSDVRQRVLATLRAHGFTHAALDLSDVGDPDEASGDSHR